MEAPRSIAALLEAPAFSVLARTLLCLPFWWSGLAKVGNLHGSMTEARGLGLHPAGLVVAATILVQLGGSASVILGRTAWLGAGALGVFTVLATLLAHGFWTDVDPVTRAHALNTFLEHMGLVGGFMVAAVLLQRQVSESAQ